MGLTIVAAAIPANGAEINWMANRGSVSLIWRDASLDSDDWGVVSTGKMDRNSPKENNSNGNDAIRPDFRKGKIE